MIIDLHPQLRVQRLSIGQEGAPLLVVDQLVADPERLVRKAARMDFQPHGAFFPGIRAPGPASYQVFLEQLATPLMEFFGIGPGRLRATSYYSLITRPPEQLMFLQRIPHIDAASHQGLAAVHYLFRGSWGGTAFYRHRATGYEYVDEARNLAYYQQLEREAQGPDAPGPGYIGEDTPMFERISQVEGVFNRLVMYRRNSLHSATIDNHAVPSPDPLTGRLSINTFIDVIP